MSLIAHKWASPVVFMGTQQRSMWAPTVVLQQSRPAPATNVAMPNPRKRDRSESGLVHEAKQQKKPTQQDLERSTHARQQVVNSVQTDIGLIVVQDDATPELLLAAATLADVACRAIVHTPPKAILHTPPKTVMMSEQAPLVTVRPACTTPPPKEDARSPLRTPSPTPSSSSSTPSDDTKPATSPRRDAPWVMHEWDRAAKPMTTFERQWWLTTKHASA